MVGATGFEPATLCSQSRCATRLRYTPPFRKEGENRKEPGSASEFIDLFGQVKEREVEVQIETNR